MKKAIILVFLAFAVNTAKTQTVAKSIFAEYGYPNISKDSVVQYMMFGITKYRVYQDEKYLKVESYQDLSEEDAKKIGPTLHTLFVKEIFTDKTFLCVSIDTLRIKMDGGEKGRESFQQIKTAYSAGSEAIYKIGTKNINIQGLECTEFFVQGKYVDTISAFISNLIILDPSIHDFPLYVNGSEEGKSGLLMGRNEILWDGKMIEFRAVKLEINKPIDIAAELAEYRLVSEAEGEKEMKAIFTKMMGLPEGDGKN